MAKKIP